MIEIIPAIDIIDGKCVRLSQGDYNQKVIYNNNPLDVALQFEDAGIKRLHLVDLDGAKAGDVKNWNVLKKISSNTKLIIDFGGGIKTGETIERVFNVGAHIATLGSIAVKQPEVFYSWIEKYGADKIFLGADVKNEMITLSGWLEQTTVSIFDFLDTVKQRGVVNYFCTDISKDGLLQGVSTELYKKLMNYFPSLNLVASGGVSSIEDIDQLNTIGCKGVIVGKAIYEGRITLNQLKKYAC
jgi:phosphoribosylformimino-5-aminoimidazole carboxamide ribotide isomerase